MSCSSGASLSRVLTPYFLLPLSFILALFYISVTPIAPAGSPWRGDLPVQGSTLKWISWYIRSPFHFPGMWPGSYWWRGIRWQRPGPEVRLVLCYCTRLPTRLKIQQFCCGWWTRLALWVFCTGGGKKSREMRRRVCVCVCSCMQACACLLFSRLPQAYNMSQDYPTLSFLVKISLYHSLRLPRSRRFIG